MYHLASETWPGSLSCRWAETVHHGPQKDCGLAEVLWFEFILLKTKYCVYKTEDFLLHFLFLQFMAS